MADKSKTIKNANDQELNDLIVRLRKESELQYLISDLKRKSTTQNGYSSYDTYTNDVSTVSTEQPIESMYHVGVLGMHWGRRKAKGSIISSGKNKKSPKEDDSEDHKKKKILKKRKIHQLSNAELKTLNDRLQLEKQFKELTKSDMSAGKKFVMDILKDLRREAVKDITKRALTGDFKNSPYTKSLSTVTNTVKTATKKKRPIGFRTS